LSYLLIEEVIAELIKTAKVEANVQAEAGMLWLIDK